LRAYVDNRIAAADRLGDDQPREVKDGKCEAESCGEEKHQKGSERREAKTHHRPSAEIDSNGTGKARSKSGAQPARTLAKPDWNRSP
jgi:hypothetical protein